MVMSPIRVLHIVGPMNRGGIETFLMNIYRRIHRDRVQFDFLVTRDDPGVFDREIEELGGRIFRVPNIREVGVLNYLGNVRRVLTDHPDYRVIHCHVNSMAGLFQPVAKAVGISTRISHGHSAPVNQTYSDLSQIARRISSYVLRYSTVLNSTHYFACSYNAGAWLFGSRVANRELTIVKSGVDSNKFAFDEQSRRRMRALLSLPDDAYVVGHVGNMHRVKNHVFLIDVFDALVSINPHSVLCLVGDGHLRSDIEHRITERGLCDKVKLLGTRGDVDDLLRAFDVFVMPSLYEGLPVSLIEAQAASLPCIISTSITKEVDLGLGLVDFLSLEDGSDVWAKVILQKANCSRTSESGRIIESGYDSQVTAEWLESFYISQHNTKYVGIRLARNG